MANVEATTMSGRVRGERNDAGITVFKGIPYAAAPVGELRFRPPQPHPGWTDVRDALTIGNVGPQNGSMEAMLLGADMPPQSEDCLFLNVWTPAFDPSTGSSSELSGLPSEARMSATSGSEQRSGSTVSRPVMVWIHGGSYVTGSGSNPWYSGDALASVGDVVIVNANYRIGAFGFCHLGDVGGERFAGSGNLGLLDQIEVLRWVQDNIAHFGGDANNVTVFGESAGGGAVLALLATPAATGLFHKAIVQSASIGQFRSRERADAVGRQLLDELGIPHDQAHDLLDRSTADILAAQATLEAWPHGIDAFAPTPDGVVLPDSVIGTLHDGSAPSHVPVMIGTNLDEMRLFTAFDPANAAVDEEAVVKRAAEEIDHDSARPLVEAYRNARPGATWGQIASTLATEHTFHQPAVRVAAARAAHGHPTWMYRFTWQSPAFGGIFGSSHAMEIPFVFGTLVHPGAVMLTGDSDDRHTVSKAMQQAWLSFARDGDPGWAEYSTHDRATMIFDTTSEVRHDPEGDLRALWP
jgi:para-nitrobenzyl esterase